MNDIFELCIEKHLYEAIAAALHVDAHRVRVGDKDTGRHIHPPTEVPQLPTPRQRASSVECLDLGSRD